MEELEKEFISHEQEKIEHLFDEGHYHIYNKMWLGKTWCDNCEARTLHSVELKDSGSSLPFCYGLLPWKCERCGIKKRKRLVPFGDEESV